MHWIATNPKPNQQITDHTPWRILILDAIEAHLSKAVYKAAHAKNYILLHVPGGLTGDLQVCDTHLNKEFKAKYKELEKGWIIATLEEIKEHKEQNAIGKP